VKRSNKELGFYKIPIKYLGIVQKIIEQGKASTAEIDNAILVGLLQIGRSSGAFYYERGEPILMKSKNMEIISVNDESFRIWVYDKANNTVKSRIVSGERTNNP
jgi:hypothetical protein